MAEREGLTWITGVVPVSAVLEAGSRTVARVLVQDDRYDSATARVQQLAREQSIPLDRVAPSVVDRYVGSQHHGGIIAEVGARRFLRLAQLLEGPEPPAIFMLDGVEDPHNLGQAVRALFAAGATGLVLRSRNWLSVSDIVIRASAGASEFIPVAVAESPEQAAEHFHGSGLRVLAATQQDAVPLYDTDLTAPFFLIIGGEKRGISRGLQQIADSRVSIPYGRTFSAALGTAAAAAVIGFEMLRQRQAAGAGG